VAEPLEAQYQAAEVAGKEVQAEAAHQWVELQAVQQVEALRCFIQVLKVLGNPFQKVAGHVPGALQIPYLVVPSQIMKMAQTLVG
jgi:hypothetical protein